MSLATSRFTLILVTLLLLMAASRSEGKSGSIPPGNCGAICADPNCTSKIDIPCGSSDPEPPPDPGGSGNGNGSGPGGPGAGPAGTGTTTQPNQITTVDMPMPPSGTPGNKPLVSVGADVNLSGLRINAVKEPISTADGTISMSIVDFSYDRPGYPIRFQRNYNSRVSSANGGLGAGWTHNYDQNIYWNGFNKATFFDSKQIFTFSYSTTTGTFNSPAGSFLSLESIHVPAGGAVPPDLAGHLNLSNLTQVYGLSSGSVDFLKVTNKFGSVKYFAAFSPGSPDDFKVLLEKDLHGRTLQYIYQNYIKEVRPLGGTSYGAINDTRLSQVRGSFAGPGIVNWTMEFSYYSPTNLLGTQVIQQQQYTTFCYYFYTPDRFEPKKGTWSQHCDSIPIAMSPVPVDTGRTYGQYLARVSCSQASASVYFINEIYPTHLKNPVLLDQVVRNVGVGTATCTQGIDDGTGAPTICGVGPGIGGDTATYTYDSTFVNPVNGLSPVLASVKDRLAAPRNRNLAFEYGPCVPSSSDCRTRGVNKVTNGRGQVELVLDYPLNPPLGSTFNSRTYLGGTTLSFEDHYSIDSTGGISLGSQTRYLDGGSYTETYTYNSDNLRTSVIDGKGNRKEWNYSPLGNLLTYKDQADIDAGRVGEQFSYGINSRLEKYTDRELNLTEYIYGNGIDITQIKEPLSRTTDLVPIPFTGRLQIYTDPNHHTTTLGYDINGNLNSITEPNITLPDGSSRPGAVTTLGFNVRSQLVISTDPMKQGSDTFIWNVFDQLKDINFADGTNNHFDYDASGTGNLTLARDAKNIETVYGYDGDGNLTDLLEANNTADVRHTVIDYDSQSNRIKVTDPKNQVTNFIYNQQDLIKSIQDAVSPPMTFTYDNALNLSTKTDGRGVTLTYDYFKNYLLRQLLSSGGGIPTTQIDYTYYPNGNRQTMVDAEGLKTYHYDALNRPSDVQNSATGSTVSYLYDSVGNKKQVTESTTNSAILYDYYENDLLKVSKHYPTFPGTAFDATTYFYDDLRNATRIDYPGGVAKALLTYKPISHRLLEFKNVNFRGETISNFGMGYDAIGNVTSTTTAFGTATYDYDGLQQLKAASYPVGSAAYHYDLAGNRDSVTENGITKTFAYNSSNQILPAARFPFDNSGNQLGKDITVSGPFTFGTSYQWDALNRLTQIHRQPTPSDPLVVSNYVYNGDNQRIRKTVGANVTNYLFDGLQVLAETDAGGTPKRLYNPGISVTDDKGNKFYTLFNGHGDVANLIDKDGNIVDAYSYDAFGKTTGVSRNSNGSRYVGGLGIFSDDDAGLQYDWNRWYDPELGRFISRDPLGFGGGDLNLYGYVWNNPTSMIDPSGLLGAGINLGYNAAAGGGALVPGSGGVAASAGYGFGMFSQSALGIFAYFSKATPKSDNAVSGAYAGASVGPFITTAKSAKAMAAIPKNFNLSVGYLASFTLDIGYGNGDYSASLTFGPGGGVALSTTDINTKAIDVIPFAQSAPGGTNGGCSK